MAGEPPGDTSPRQPTEEQRIEVWRNDVLMDTVRKAALDEAAMICDAEAAKFVEGDWPEWARAEACRHVAALIRGAAKGARHD